MKRFVKDMKKFFGYSIVSAKAQLRSEIVNSYLYWFWWVLDPLCFMLIYTFIFGFVFHASEQYFPVFIFIGLTMWDFFSRMVNSSVKIIKSNKAIVTKVYLPKYILIYVKMWVNSFKMLIAFVIVLVMIIFYRIPVTVNILFFIPIMVTLCVFSFGCAAYLLHYGVFVEDLLNVVSIGLRLVFYLTGIFYNIDSRIPNPYRDLLINLNPMAFLIDSMRRILLYGRSPNLIGIMFWFMISIVLAIGGIKKIYKNENSYIKVI